MSDTAQGITELGDLGLTEPWITDTGIHRWGRGEHVTEDEIALVREAALRIANGPADVDVNDLAVRWEAVVWPLARLAEPRGGGWRSAWIGSRLCATYVAMYPALEEEGEIDGWGGSESLTVLTSLVFEFLEDDDARWRATRDAVNVAWDMGWAAARESIRGDLALAALRDEVSLSRA